MEPSVERLVVEELVHHEEVKLLGQTSIRLLLQNKLAQSCTAGVMFARARCRGAPPGQEPERAAGMGPEAA